MKKMIKLMSAAIALSTLSFNPINVMAETRDTSIADGLGSVEIFYTDDALQTQPIKGSTWRLYQVGELQTIVDETGVNAYDIVELITNLYVDGETTAEEVLGYLKTETVNESYMTIGDVSISGDKLNYVEGVTDVSGRLMFEDLEYGLYLGVEVKAAEDHLLTSPFLVTVANTDVEGLESTLDVTVEPKAALAGDLKVTKELKGDNTEANREWSMEFTLPEGKYVYETSDGDDGIVKDGDVIKIKGGESITIDNVMVNGAFIVTEEEENKDGYKTTYKDNEGKIEFGQTLEVIVTNERNADEKLINLQPTFDKWIDGISKGEPSAVIPTGVIVIALGGGLLLFIKRKNDKSQNK